MDQPLDAYLEISMFKKAILLAAICTVLGAQAPKGMVHPILGASSATPGRSGGVTEGPTVKGPWVGAVSRSAQDKAQDVIHSRDFGAVGDGIVDDTLALQSGIEAAILSKKTLVIGSGYFKINSPLRIFNFRAGHWGYVTCTIKGERSLYGASGEVPEPMLGTILRPTFNHLPALMIQGGRGVRIESISIVGTNDLYRRFADDATYPRLMTVSNLNLNGARDSRYSPNCGIAIDPFGTALPPDGGYPGYSDHYAGSATGSANTMLVNVDIKNFVVALLLSPNGTTSNNDHVICMNCEFGYSKVAVAGGQSQSRGVNLQSCRLYLVYTAFDGVSYGAQTWGGPKVYGGIALGVKFLVNLYATSQDPTVFSGLYCESLSAIGYFATAGSLQSPVTFQGCAFNFSDFFGRGAHPDYHVYTTSTPISFVSCTFNTANEAYQGPLRLRGAMCFRDCTFTETQSGEPFLAPTTGVDSVEWSNVQFDNCLVSESRDRGDGPTSRLSDRNLMYALVHGYGDRTPIPFGALVSLTQNPTVLLYNGTGWAQRIPVGPAQISINTPSIGRATMITADPGVFRVGDLVYTSILSGSFEGPSGDRLAPGFICIGLVASVSGSRITLNGIPQSLVEGEYSCFLEWIPRIHAASRADATVGSTKLTNVSPSTSWRVGHRIKGAGIPVGAYVVAVNGTTLTLSKVATATAAQIRIFDADMRVLKGTDL